MKTRLVIIVILQIIFLILSETVHATVFSNTNIYSMSRKYETVITRTAYHDAGLIDLVLSGDCINFEARLDVYNYISQYNSETTFNELNVSRCSEEHNTVSHNLFDWECNTCKQSDLYETPLHCRTTPYDSMAISMILGTLTMAFPEDLNNDEIYMCTRCSLDTTLGIHTITQSYYNSPMTLKLNRQGGGKGKLTVEGELVVKSKSNTPFDNFTINEAIPHVISVDYSGRQDSAGYYFWQGQVKWEFTIDEGSGDYFTLTPAASVEYVNFKMDKISAVFDACSLGIESFRISPSSTFTPSSGGSINFSSTINDTSDQATYWTLSVLDQTFNGSGNSVNATWDGKRGDGTVVLPGTYSATLTATTADGQCSDSKTINFTVIPPPDGQCGLYVQFGSSAHLPSGNLNHSQNLFSAQGGSLPLGLTLYYNSLDPHNGSLGRGWSHSYEIFLKENSDGSVLIDNGNMKYDYFTSAGGVYTPQAGNYSILAKGSDETFTLTTKDGQVSTYLSDGKLATISDRSGNTLTFIYNGSDLSTVTDPSGRTVNFTYDAAHHLTSVTDPSGNVYLFSVGTTLAGVTQPDGGTWQYAYDANAYMHIKTDPIGNNTIYAYDDKHRVISSTDPEGRTRNITYPLTTTTVKSTTFTEKDGGVWAYSYDTLKGTLNSKTDPQGGVTSYTYDAVGNRTSTTLPDGSTSTATYDAVGNMLASTDAMGQTTSYSYNSFGQVLSITDPQRGLTAFAYDSKGNMTSLTDPAGASTKYEYDAKGNITKITDPVGQTTSFVYDQKGNLFTVTDSGGAITSYTYDSVGNVTSITDPKGAVTQFVYDARNRLIKTIDPNGNNSTFSYDINGNKLSDTDANGNGTKYEYNSQNQLIKTIDSMNNVTIYAYGGSTCPSCGDSTDKLSSITDANSNATRYTYDRLGRLVTETDPLGNVTSYTYDLKGNMTAKTDANGSTTSYSYDANDRLLKKVYPDDTEETYTYDTKGNILSASNKDIAYTFSYDTTGRLMSSTDSNGKVLQYSYDTGGRKTKTIYPDGSVVSYAYDGTGRLASITNGGGRQYSYSYDKLGRQTKLSYPNGTTVSYTYDVKGNLTSLIHKTSTDKVINSFSYTHDKVGNRLTKAEPDITFNYGYDPVYRLLSALPTKPHGRGNWQGHKEESYSYDPVGNRLTGLHDHETYAYGPDNELLSTRHLQFGYDKNGNRVEKARLHQEERSKGEQNDHDGNRYGNEKWSYSFDFENRLIKAEKKHGHETTIVTFKYDPFGRRIEKRIKEGANCRSIHTYIYDGQAIILETETTGEGRHQKTETTKYVHGPNIDEPLAMTRDKEVYFYHADGLGSVVALTDSAGRVVQAYEYDSFGTMQSHKNRVEQPFTYTGREWDKETGLYYYRARYYDSMEGRFISKDPISFAGGVNLYSYVGNNPLNYIDPTGLFGAGGPGSTYPGHADFPGNFPDSENFNYNLEDTDPFTSPYTDPERHFRDLPQSEADVASAISSCNKNAFQRAMHRGQDFFSHYSKGYRWKPFRMWLNLGFGHLFDGTTPDEDIVAWNEAGYWTEQQLNKWRNKCGCKEQ